MLFLRALCTLNTRIEDIFIATAVIENNPALKFQPLIITLQFSSLFLYSYVQFRSKWVLQLQSVLGYPEILLNKIENLFMDSNWYSNFDSTSVDSQILLVDASVFKILLNKCTFFKNRKRNNKSKKQMQIHVKY